MITKIKINGFKSFHNFEMEFTPLTVIAGINASGKSNLFDALMLLGRLSETDNLKKTFSEQRGEFIELFTQYKHKQYAKEMSFEVEMLVDKDIKDSWGNVATLKYTRLKYELKIKRFKNEKGIEELIIVHESLENIKKDDWLKNIPKKVLEYWQLKISKGGRKKIYIETKEKTENEHKIGIVYQDSNAKNNTHKKEYILNNANRTILSSFDTTDFPHILAVKQEMRNWSFLQLNPEELRKPAKKNNGIDKISTNGGNLAAVLYRIKQQDEYKLIEISRKLNSFLPNFISIDVFEDIENEQYIIKLKDNKGNEYSPKVLSEGTLRILAICILEQDDKRANLLCFEEPENGIHPSQIKTMASLLKDLSNNFRDLTMPLQQIIINTHSPILLGSLYYVDDYAVSIWFSQMRNMVIDIIENEEKRIKIDATKILPVIKNENDNDFNVQFPEQNKKITFNLIQQYLEKDYSRV